MPKFAYFPSAAPQPAAVIGWIDSDLSPDQVLPPAADLLPLDEAAWAERLATPYVLAGQLVAEGPPLFQAEPEPTPSKAELLAQISALMAKVDALPG